jgi:hypothetical protein
MKFLFLILLLLTSCKDECKDPNRPWNMFDHCNPLRPTSPTRTITSEWEKKNLKGCKHAVPGRFKVINKKSPYYKCHGIITHYPMLSDDMIWKYDFNRLYCGKHWNDSDETFFKEFNEEELKRTGNLGD